MIPLLAAAAVTLLSPDAVIARYEKAMAAVSEPRAFVVEYTVLQSGTRNIEQTHRVFRSGGLERDETIAVNGTSTTRPLVRIFRNRPFRYYVTRLAPRASGYEFTFAGKRHAGHHDDYVFHATPKGAVRAYTVTDVTIDGVTFLPTEVDFATNVHDGHGTINFAKSSTYWVAYGATASASEPAGSSFERLSFAHWHFVKSLPASTFAAPRPLVTAAPVGPP